MTHIYLDEEKENVDGTSSNICNAALVEKGEKGESSFSVRITRSVVEY